MTSRPPSLISAAEAEFKGKVTESATLGGQGPGTYKKTELLPGKRQERQNDRSPDRCGTGEPRL